MKHYLLIIIAFLGGLQICNAQITMPDALRRLPDQSLPYIGEKRDLRGDGATGISCKHGKTKLDDRIYTNIQMTEWRYACQHEAESPETCYQFVIPGRKISFVRLTLGGITDYRTDILLSVTPDGKILDQIPVAVMLSYLDIPVMQHSISADGKVTVYRLVPTSKESIELLEFTSFTANRVDSTYELDAQGKFKLIDTKKYKEKTYTWDMLKAKDYNVYSGNEIPMSSE